jgi:GAF domain-containing protein
MQQNKNSNVSFSDSLPAGGKVVRETYEHVQQMLRSGAPQRDLLTRLATAAENFAGGGAASSILVLDEDGLLRNGASPNLPSDYLAAIDRLKPDPNVGTCAAAAATGSLVITPDFCADNKWAELRHWPLSLGFVGAWSVPIKSAEGTVLGTFGTYLRDRRRPTPEEQSAVEVLATAAALVLGNPRTNQAPRAENA